MSAQLSDSKRFAAGFENANHLKVRSLHTEFVAEAHTLKALGDPPRDDGFEQSRLKHSPGN
jgi:hypothetical protein